LSQSRTLEHRFVAATTAYDRNSAGTKTERLSVVGIGFDRNYVASLSVEAARNRGTGPTEPDDQCVARAEPDTQSLGSLSNDRQGGQDCGRGEHGRSEKPGYLERYGEILIREAAFHREELDRPV